MPTPEMSVTPKTWEIRSLLEGVELGLSLQMSRGDDRYLSTILFIEPKREPVPLLMSCEGGPSENWPPSPPLQEVLLQSDGDREYLAGIGSAGSGHWSLIASPLEDQIGFEFDYACRTKRAPTWLGSCYYPVQDTLNLDADALEFDQGRSLLFHAGPESACRRMVGDGRLRIEAVVSAAVVFPATLRWKYRVTLHS